jgi:hypothetical protein
VIMGYNYWVPILVLTGRWPRETAPQQMTMAPLAPDNDIHIIQLTGQRSHLNKKNNVNVAWCLCGYCVPMSTHIEFVCCLEKAGLLDRADRCLHELCQ